MKYIPKKEKTLFDYLAPLSDNIGSLSLLTTLNQGNLVYAINEVKGNAGTSGEGTVPNPQKILTNVSDETVSIKLEATKHYVFNTPTSLTIEGFVNNGTTNSVNEYTFELITGDTAPTLTLPTGLKYAYYITPETNSTYMVSIYNDVCVMLEVAANDI